MDQQTILLLSQAASKAVFAAMMLSIFFYIAYLLLKTIIFGVKRKIQFKRANKILKTIEYEDEVTVSYDKDGIPTSVYLKSKTLKKHKIIQL